MKKDVYKLNRLILAINDFGKVIQKIQNKKSFKVWLPIKKRIFRYKILGLENK